ncbi:MAG: alpha/beta fold hydrolase [Nocardioidaceae bacterium]
MAETRRVLFVQGGGAGVHDEWDDKLVDSLRDHLGNEYRIRYPRMPDESDPSYARWSMAILGELTAMPDGAVVVGHSVGGTILINAQAATGSGSAGDRADSRALRWCGRLAQ